MRIVALVAIANYALAAPAIVTVYNTQTQVVQATQAAPTSPAETPAAAAAQTDVQSVAAASQEATSPAAPAPAAPAPASPAPAAQGSSSNNDSWESLLQGGLGRLFAYFGYGGHSSGSSSSNSNTASPTTQAYTANSPTSSALSSSAVVVQSSPVSPDTSSSSASSPSSSQPSLSSSGSGVSSSDVYAQIYSSHNIDTGFAKDILDAHNKYRADHGVGPLSWDVSAYNYAANNADNYDCSGVLTHTHGPFGENLAAGFSTGASAVKAWYDEGSSYNYNSANTYDHFTQVVWKGSTKVGCAYKDCTSTGWGKYVVCEYSPAGNVIGQNKANVLPPN